MAEYKCSTDVVADWNAPIRGDASQTVADILQRRGDVLADEVLGLAQRVDELKDAEAKVLEQEGRAIAAEVRVAVLEGQYKEMRTRAKNLGAELYAAERELALIKEYDATIWPRVEEWAAKTNLEEMTRD